jgi:hypothetical protein
VSCQGALVAGAVIGGTVGYAVTRPPAATHSYHGRGRYRSVVVVQQAPPGMPPAGPQEMLVHVSCPFGVRPGDPLEIDVEGRAYLITVRYPPLSNIPSPL